MVDHLDQWPVRLRWTCVRQFLHHRWTSMELLPHLASYALLITSLIDAFMNLIDLPSSAFSDITFRGSPFLQNPPSSGPPQSPSCSPISSSWFHLPWNNDDGYLWHPFGLCIQTLMNGPTCSHNHFNACQLYCQQIQLISLMVSRDRTSMIDSGLRYCWAHKY